MGYDIGVKGDAMQFINNVAKALDYKVVEVHIKSIEDLRGQPVIYESETTGQSYFEYDKLWWQKEIDNNANGTTLVVFNIDKANDRVVNALKSFIENREDNHFFCVFTTDINRDLKKTTIYHLIKPIITWKKFVYKNNMALIFKQTNGDKYFDGDLPFLQAFNQKANSNHKLDLSLYPEPFAGNANAKVYLLSGNPGWCDYDYQLMTSNQPIWDKMMQHSYDPIPSVGHTPTMYWLDPYWKKQIKPVNGYDGGFSWWEKRTNYLRVKEGIKDIHKKLFNIDYHPYHSKKLKIDNNIKNLPSKTYIDNIIGKAFEDEERLFIIVRCREEWEERLISLLQFQELPKNVIFLKNPRCAYLTPSNIICRRMIGKDC